MTDFDYKPRQIKTVSATEIRTLNVSPGSRDSYECANPFITRGITSSPSTYEECRTNSLYGNKVQQIVNQLDGFSPSSPWGGPSTIPPEPPPTAINSTLTGIESPECSQIQSLLGSDYKGCFWAASDSSLSCNCPEIGSKYIQYLGLRLNVATFWNTPPQTPILRKMFLDAITYGPKVTLVLAPDLALRPGNVIDVAVNALSGYSTSTATSSLSKKYYVISVKNTMTNSGVGETVVTAVDLLY